MVTSPLKRIYKVSGVFDGKSDFIQIFAPLYVMCHFLLATLKFFSLFLFLAYSYDVPRYDFHLIYSFFKFVDLCLSPNLGKYHPLFIKTNFSYLSFYLSFFQECNSAIFIFQFCLINLLSCFLFSLFFIVLVILNGWVSLPCFQFADFFSSAKVMSTEYLCCMGLFGFFS